MTESGIEKGRPGLLATWGLLLIAVVNGCTPAITARFQETDRQPASVPVDITPTRPPKIAKAVPTLTQDYAETAIPLKVETPLAATLQAVKRKGETTSFVPKDYFTREKFKIIESNIYYYQFDTVDGVGNPVVVCATGWLLKTPDINNNYLVTATHGFLQDLPPQLYLEKAGNNRKANPSLALIPDAMAVDDERDITIFRIPKKLGKNIPNLGVGLVAADDVTPSEDALYGFFGFPRDFNNKNSLTLLGTLIEPKDIFRGKQITKLLPDYQDIPDSLLVVSNQKIDYGNSGGALIRVDKKTGQISVIGTLFAMQSKWKDPQAPVHVLFHTLDTRYLLEQLLKRINNPPTPRPMP